MDGGPVRWDDGEELPGQRGRVTDFVPFRGRLIHSHDDDDNAAVERAKQAIAVGRRKFKEICKKLRE